MHIIQVITGQLDGIQKVICRILRRQTEIATARPVVDAEWF